MAKLNGVKIVDMVDGKITKVEFDGVLYMKVDDGTANVGDIMLSLIAEWDTTRGAFYEVADTGYRDVYKYTFFDDVEDEAHFHEGQAVVFRKESASSEGFHEIDVKDAMIGDFVKFKDSYGDHIIAGRLYEIAEIDSFGDPQVLDEDGDLLDTFMENFVVLRKDAEEQAEPELEVGDIVVITGEDLWNSRGCRNKVGDIGKIVGLGFTGRTFKVEVPGGPTYANYTDKDEVRRATDEEIEKYEKAVADLEFDKFEKGDKVKLLSGGGGFPLLGFENGKTYEITDMNYDHPRGRKIEIKPVEGMKGYADPSQLEKVVEETIEEPIEEVTPKVRVKAGDLVRVEDPCGAPLSRGQVVKAIRDAERLTFVMVEGGWLVTATEVVEEPDSKFKVGDIARVIDSPSASPEGSLVEITSVFGDSIYAKGVATFSDKIMKYVYSPKHLEYVASK